MSRKLNYIPHIMNNFVRWFYNADFTPNGEVFDVGRTTSDALENYHIRHLPLHMCGGKSYADNGNGALMRILPVALVEYTDPDAMANNVVRVAALTHNH